MIGKAIMMVIAAASSAGQAEAQPDAGQAIIPARDGNIAIKQEYCAARRAGTVEAYDLFIARHPAHRLADRARRERARLLER